MKRNYADIAAISAKSLGEWSAIGLSIKTGVIPVWATVPDEAVVYLDADQTEQVKSAETEIGLVELKARITRSAVSLATPGNAGSQHSARSLTRQAATPGGRIGPGLGGGRAIPFYFPGDKVPHFRCPPGTRRGGKWTDKLGSDCELGGSRAALSRIGQRIDRIAQGQRARGDMPSLTQRAGLRGKPSLTPQPLSRQRVRRGRNNAPSRLRQFGRRLDLNDRENQARARRPLLRRNQESRQRTSTPSRLRQFGRRMDFNDRENQARARQPILRGRDRRQRRETPEALRRFGRRLDLNDPENQARARRNRSRRQPETRQRSNTPERLRNVGRRLDLNDPENFERARRRRQRRKPETRERSDTPNRLRRFGREMDFNDRENQARARRPLFGRRRRTEGELPKPERTTRRRSRGGRSTNTGRGMDAVTDTAGAGKKPRPARVDLKRSPKGDAVGREDADRFIKDSIRRRGDKTTNQLEKQQTDIYGRLLDINTELMHPRTSVERAQVLRAEQQYLRERNQELQSRVLGQVRDETADAVNAAIGKTPRSSGGSVVNAVAKDIRDRRSSRAAIGYGNRRFNEIASNLVTEPDASDSTRFVSTREQNLNRLTAQLSVLDVEIREFENAARRHHPDGADPDPDKYDDMITQVAIRRHAVSRVESAIEMRQGELRKARQREAASGKSSDRGLMDLGIGHPAYGGQTHTRAVADLRARVERNLNRPDRPATSQHFDYIEDEIEIARRGRQEALSQARARLRNNDLERAAYYGERAAKLDEHLKWLEQRRQGMGARPTMPADLAERAAKAAERGADPKLRHKVMAELAASNTREADRLASRIAEAMALDIYSREGVTEKGAKYRTEVRTGDVIRNTQGSYSFYPKITIYDEDGNRVNSIGSREVHLSANGNSRIYHAHFYIDPDYQDKGFGGGYIRDTMVAAKEQGIDIIDVTATSNRGGEGRYIGVAVWPRLGFEIEPGSLVINSTEQTREILAALGLQRVEQITAQHIRDNFDLFSNISGHFHGIIRTENIPSREEFIGGRGVHRVKAAQQMTNKKNGKDSKPYVASAAEWMDILDNQWPQLQGFNAELDKSIRKQLHAEFGPKPQRRGSAKRTTLKKKK